MSGGIGVGAVSTGWFGDAYNVAARFTAPSGDFYVQNAGGAATYMRVGAGQNGMRLFNGNAVFDQSVGIGTTTPGYPLDVAGTARVTGFICGGNMLLPIAGVSGIKDSSGTRLVMDENGAYYAS